MTTNEILEILRANAYNRTAFAGTVIVPKVVLEEAITKITALALRTDPVPLAKALGDLQRHYAAAVGDFVTINGALQLRNAELLRESKRRGDDCLYKQGEINKLQEELKRLRPPEPLFKLNEVALIVHVTNGTTLITSRRFTADGRWEYLNGYSQCWYAEASLKKLSEENKG